MELSSNLIVPVVVVAVLVIGFLLLGWRDLLMLVRRPSKKLGAGVWRVMAVGRVTVIEAWAGRIWLLPLLWFIVAMILISVVRPYTEQERISEYIRMLLISQEILLLIMMWVMSCVSIPKEREKKILVTNASKPISRLEIMLGKMVGFAMVAALCLAVMGLTSYAVLLVSNQRIKSRAMAQYTLAESDYANRKAEEGTAPPPEEKKILGEQGSLFAYNYIAPARSDFSVLGMVDFTSNPAKRYIKGASTETVHYLFTPNIVAPIERLVAPTGQKPYFEFHFPTILMPHATRRPSELKLHVTAVRHSPFLSVDQSTPQEGTVTLDDNLNGKWEPDRPQDLFSDPEDDRGPVEVTVSCVSPGVYMQVLDGRNAATAGPTDYNVIAVTNFGGMDANGNQTLQAFVPQPNPTIYGFERRDRQQIEGPNLKEQERTGVSLPELAEFRFTAASMAKVPRKGATVPLSLFIDVDKQSNESADTYAKVILYNEDNPQNTWSTSVRVIERRKTEIDVPASYLGNTDPKKQPAVVVLVACETVGHWLGLAEDSVRFDQPATPFFINLLKSELTIFAEAALLIVVGVAASLRLDWPVAMLATFVVVVLGYLESFVSELLSFGGLDALNISSLTHKSAVYHFFSTCTEYLWKALHVIVHMVPDFSLYDPTSFIINLQNRPWGVVGADIGAAILYAIPVAALGYLLIRKQELG